VDDARSVGLEFRSIRPPGAIFVINGRGRVRLANVHVRYRGSASELDQLLFRDYLRAHPGVVRDYVRVKRRALMAGLKGRDYTAAKAPFIEALKPRMLRWARRASWAARPPSRR